MRMMTREEIKNIECGYRAEMLKQLELTPDSLTKLLTAAKEAHTLYERTRGEVHPEWEPFYAGYIMQRINSGDLPR
jgi:hypothetical protein